MNKRLSTALTACFIIVLTSIFSLSVFAGDDVVTPGNGIAASVTKSKAIELSWVALGTKAIDYIEVERSFTNEQFVTVGLVMGAEKIENSRETYRFKDALKNVKKQKVVYYRNKVIYTDGTAAYMPVAVVRITQQ